MKKLNYASILLAALLISCGNSTQQQTDESKTEEVATVVTETASQKKSEIKKEGGVDFQELSLAQATDSAKAQGKMLFINIHIKNCTPCRLMEKKIFPQEKIGTYINERFISISLDGEEGEGKELATQYQIFTYPTYFIMDTTNTVIGKILGADKDIDSFINKIEAIINPSEEKNEE